MDLPQNRVERLPDCLPRHHAAATLQGLLECLNLIVLHHLTPWSMLQ